MEQPKPDLPEEIATPSLEFDTVFETFFQKIKELPLIPKPRSAKDYLKTNQAKIIHALSKRYTYEQLAALLNECKFSISASTLRRYIGPVKGRKGDESHQDLIPDATTNAEEISMPTSPNSQPLPKPIQFRERFGSPQPTRLVGK